MIVLWIDAPTACRALRDGAAIVVPSVPPSLQVGDVVAIGEPWALRHGGVLALEYRHTGQSYLVFDEAIRAEAERWALSADQWHTEMTPWAVRRWAIVTHLYPNAADGSVAAVLKQTAAPS